jgi:hypothetical protein
MRHKSWRLVLTRKFGWRRGVKQAGPANQRPVWPAPWGPHCYLTKNRHDAPFSKRAAGHLRRAARLHRLRERDAMLTSAERDDGYFSMEGHYE